MAEELATVPEHWAPQWHQVLCLLKPNLFGHAGSLISPQTFHSTNQALKFKTGTRSTVLTAFPHSPRPSCLTKQPLLNSPLAKSWSWGALQSPSKLQASDFQMFLRASTKPYWAAFYAGCTGEPAPWTPEFWGSCRWCCCNAISCRHGAYEATGTCWTSRVELATTLRARTPLWIPNPFAVTPVKWPLAQGWLLLAYSESKVKHAYLTCFFL